MTSVSSLLRFDPIVGELLKAGFTTYKKHFKIYILLNIVSISIFALILGLPTSIHSNMDVYISITHVFQSYQEYTQTVLFYGFIGLIVTIITYYLTFRGTLRSGELGIEINTPWTVYNQFFIILIYDLVLFLYLLLWVSFFRSVASILLFNKLGFFSVYELDYSLEFIFLFFIIFLLIAFFLFLVKMSYFIYMLDELKVPTQALDPIIFMFGFCFGCLIIFLDFLNFYFFYVPDLQEISIIITYLTPGTIIMPILGYSMAHLKVASTLLGFEPLFE